MKKLIYLATLLCCTMLQTAVVAQEAIDKSEPKTGKKPTDATKKAGRDRLVIDLFHDNWLTKPDTVTTKWYGRGIGVYSMLLDKNLIKKNVSFAVGVGLSSHNVYNNVFVEYYDIDSTLLTPVYANVTNATTGVVEKVSVDYKKNKINTTYVDVPVELRFRTNPNAKGRSFKLGLGARVGYLISAHTKYKGNDLTGLQREVKIKEVITKNNNLNRFRYGLNARIGYGNINIFGFYSLSTLFEKNQGPEVVPFSVGISFNGL